MASNDKHKTEWPLSLEWDKWEESERPPLTTDEWKKTMEDIDAINTFYDPAPERRNPLPGKVERTDVPDSPKPAYTASLRPPNFPWELHHTEETIEKALEALLEEFKRYRAVSNWGKIIIPMKSGAEEIERIKTQSAKKT